MQTLCPPTHFSLHVLEEIPMAQETQAPVAKVVAGDLCLQQNFITHRKNSISGSL